MAARFWVGGTGTWDAADTTHWSATTGGAGGQSVPTGTGDTATFDGSSGAGTVTVNTTVTLGTLTTSAFTGTLDFATNNNNVNLTTFTNSGSGTRTINMGNGTWTMAANGVWAQTGATNLTWNKNSSTLIFSGSSGTSSQIVNLGSYSYNTVTFNADGGGIGTNWNTGAGQSITTLNIASPNYFFVANSNTLTITNLNFTGGTPSLSSWVGFISSSFGNKPTWTLSNAASGSYLIFHDMNFATSTLTAANSINLGNTTGTVSITAPSGGGGGAIGVIGG